MDITERFWSSDLKDARRGYCEENGFLVCLLCGHAIETGIIYPVGDRLFDAGKYMEHHIVSEHGSVFEFLCSLDKRITGLSDHQSSLMELFYSGKNDQEVQKELGTGSISTIRAHRFALKEKEKQSKVYLVMMDLLKEKSRSAALEKTPDSSAAMIDGRFGMTESQYKEVIGRYFPDGPEGRLSTFSMKQKYRLVILTEIIKRFEAGRVYKEREMNTILKRIYEEDPVVLRRFLIEYGFMARKKDGSGYWIKDTTGPGELFESPGAYGDTASQTESAGAYDTAGQQESAGKYGTKETVSGVYQIRNTKNGKIFIKKERNLSSLNGIRFELKVGSFRNKKLQQEWNEFGEDAFVFEILETFKEKGGASDIAKELKRLEAKWLDALQPYGERGYHAERKQRKTDGTDGRTD